MLRDVTCMKSICALSDLITNAGVCALLNQEQVALFYLPDHDKKVFALSNFDPFSNANVISRGIIGSLNGEVVVASPIYKQHFSLQSGQCLEDKSVKLKTFEVDLLNDQVVING